MSTQCAFAAALLDPRLACPPALQAWNGTPVDQRFAVYRNNVMASLTGSLADTFPVVQALVGAEFFRAMAAVFVRASPPRSPLLAQFGAGFADFIDGFAPAQSVPYLADVARLEMARVEAFHAADVPALAAHDACAAIRVLASDERVTGLRLGLHPSLRLVRSRFPVFSIWAAHQGEGDLESVDLALGESALVLRPELDVVTLPLEGAAAQFVAGLQRGQALGESAAIAAAPGTDFDLAATLALLWRLRAIVSIELPSGDLP